MRSNSIFEYLKQKKHSKDNVSFFIKIKFHPFEFKFYWYDKKYVYEWITIQNSIYGVGHVEKHLKYLFEKWEI